MPDRRVGLEEFKALRRGDSIGHWMREVLGLKVMVWFLTRTTSGRAEIAMSVVVRHRLGAGVGAVAQRESTAAKSTHHQGITTGKVSTGEVEDGV